jgi:molybdenum cofactor cytidylyltransferase
VAPGLTAGIILAAGESKRMGRPKQLIDLGGRTMLQRVADAALASSLAPVYVVLGHEAEAVRASLAGRDVRIVLNPDYREGLGASVRVGVAALPDEVEAAMFLLGDQPGLSAAAIDALLAHAWPDGIVAPLADGRQGNPTLFGRRWFGELARCSGDRGGRSVIAAHPEALRLVEVEADLRDVDTPQDLAGLC